MEPYTITLNSKAMREKAVRAVGRAPEGCRVTFDEKKHSDEQRKKFHAMVGEVSQQVIYYGKKRSKAAWKTLFVASYEAAECLPSLDGQTIVQIRKSTAEYSERKYSDLIEIVYAYGAENGVVFREREAA